MEHVEEPTAGSPPSPGRVRFSTPSIPAGTMASRCPASIGPQLQGAVREPCRAQYGGAYRRSTGQVAAARGATRHRQQPR
jgi:hypothetical protein